MLYRTRSNVLMAALAGNGPCCIEHVLMAALTGNGPCCIEHVLMAALTGNGTCCIEHVLMAAQEAGENTGNANLCFPAETA